MTNKISYIITESDITAVIDGENYTITSDNASYRHVIEAIRAKESPSVIADLFRTANAVKRYLRGTSSADIVVDAENGELYYKGELVHNHVVDRILEFMSQGLPPEPLINFLGRLLANPSKRAIEELYRFCEHKHLPITNEGMLLAYKGVREDYTDVHSGKFLNVPGAEFKMVRNLVDDDARRACSNGFHVGSLEYATGFGPKCVIVEVDPADVVSVPFDCDGHKMRVCKYRVKCDYKGALPNTLANTAAPYRSFLDDEDEDEDYGDGGY